MKTIKRLFATLIAVAAVGLFAGCDVLGDAYMISGVTWVIEEDIGGNTVITELNLNMDDDLTFTQNGEYEDGKPFLFVVGTWMIEKDQESGENLLLLTAKKTSSDGGVTFITLNTESVSKYFYTVTMDTLEIRNVNSPDTVFKYTKK